MLKDLTPSDILTREAFENIIVINSAIGSSTNALIHLNAIARRIEADRDSDDWQRVDSIPLLVNLQPVDTYLGEEFHPARGLPAIVNKLIKASKIQPSARTINRKTSTGIPRPRERRYQYHPDVPCMHY